MFSEKDPWIYSLTACFGIIVICLVTQVNTEGVTHHVRSGESVILECDVSSPSPDVPFIVQWKKQGIETPIYLKFQNYPSHIDPQFFGRVSLYDRASLEISDIQAEDDGWYECKVMFLNGQHDQLKNGTWSRLKVSAPPTFIETSPSRVIFTPGSDMTLMCRTSGSPRPTITWQKDDEVIRPGPRTEIGDETLTLHKVGVEDSGAYTCTAASDAGRNSKTIRVIIQGPPHFVVTPQNITVQEDDKAILECVAVGAPPTITYRWYKNNIEIERLANLKHRLQMLLQGSMLITTVHLSDQGVFTCRPDNGVGVPPSASAYLTVLHPASVVNMPATTYIPKGLKGIIPCPIRSNPPVSYVTWTKDWEDLLPEEIPRYSVTQNGQLQIKDIKEEDEGRYTCTPYNDLGTRGESLPMYVFVEDPPVFTVRPHRVYQREVGQQVTFHCAAKGTPEPTIKWRRADGTEPKDRTYYNNGHLTISYLRKEDHGKYECLAVNKVTTIVTATELIIENTTPHAPRNVTVTAGIYAALVSWLPAYNGGLPQRYEIWFKKLHSDDWNKVKIADEQATSVILYNLDPKTDYEVSILAKNSLGDSLFSDVVYLTTKEQGQYVPFPTESTGLLPRIPAHGPTGTRPNPPQSVRVNETETGLVIYWEAPLNSSNPIVRYIVEYREVEQDWIILEENVPASEPWFIPETLKPATHYSFRVFALTESAFSEPSSVVMAYTGDIAVYNSQDSFPTPVVVAVVGALCFLVVISLLTALAVIKIHRKRKEKKRVSFANAIEASKKSGSSPNDGTPRRHHLPTFKPILMPFFRRLKEKFRKRDEGKGNPDDAGCQKVNKGVTVNDSIFGERSLFPKKYKVPANRVEVNFSGPISKISRSADGKFVVRAENDYVEDVSQSRPDLLPDYHDDIAGVFAGSSDSTSSFTTDENCTATTGSSDSQLKAPSGPKVTYVAPQTVYKPEEVYTSSPAEGNDGKPLEITDVSSVRMNPHEISGWEKWTKEEVYEIMHRMQELGYDSAYGAYDLESVSNGNDDDYEFIEDYDAQSGRSDSHSQLASVRRTAPPFSSQSQEQLERPRMAHDSGRPHSSMTELLSRRPSQRQPIYSPSRSYASTNSSLSTLRNVGSIRELPDSTSQQTICVDVHCPDEDMQFAGAGDYVTIQAPTYYDEVRVNTPLRRNEITPVAPIKPLRYSVSVDSVDFMPQQLMLTPEELKCIAKPRLSLTPSTDTVNTNDTLQETMKEKDATLTDLRKTFPALENISNGNSSPASRASITSTNSSGRGSRTTTLSRSSRGGSYHQQESFTPSISSGIGSHTASHSIASFHPRSVSQLSEMDQNSLDSPFSDKSSPFSLHQKDNSIDENYEFDTQPLQSELLAALKQISIKSSKSAPKKNLIAYRKKGFEPKIRELIPKVKTLPQYEDTEARCAKLKEEFLEYQRKQGVERRKPSQTDQQCETNYETTTMV